MVKTYTLEERAELSLRARGVRGCQPLLSWGDEDPAFDLRNYHPREEWPKDFTEANGQLIARAQADALDPQAAA